MYADTPWLGRSGSFESPTTAIVFACFSNSVIGSVLESVTIKAQTKLVILSANLGESREPGAAVGQFDRYRTIVILSGAAFQP
jgi:hypothetical protein